MRIPRLPLVSLLCCAAASAEEPQSPPTRPGIASISLENSIPEAMLDPDREPAVKTGDVANGTLILKGLVDRSMRESFHAAMARSDITTVRVTSHGGNAVEALQMGATMQARGLDVVVHGLCIGPCAQYLFIAGKKRRIEKGGLVGFFASIKSSGSILQTSTDMLEVPNTLAASFQALASIEEAFYQRSGVSPSLLRDSETALQPRCVVLKRTGKFMQWSTSTNYQVWVPARAYMKSVGVDFEGAWPSSRFDMWMMGGRLLKPDYLGFMRYADVDPLRRGKQKAWSPEQLKNCVADVLPKAEETP